MTPRPPAAALLRPLLVLLLAFLVLAASPAGPSLAQAPVSAAGEPAGTAAAEILDPAALEDLIGTLQDPAALATLIERLRLLQAAREVPDTAERPVSTLGARLLEGLSEQLDEASTMLVAAGGALAELPTIGERIAGQFSAPGARELLLEQLAIVALVLACGALGFAATALLIRRPRRALDRRYYASLSLRALALVLRFALDLLAIIGFAAGAYAALFALDPVRVPRLVALALVNATLLIQVAMAVARLGLAPRAPGLRLFRIGDETAHYLEIWMRRIAFVAIYGWSATEAALLLGLGWSAHQALLKLVGLLVTVLAAMLVLQNRKSMAVWLRGRHAGRRGVLATARRRLADLWHVLALLYILVAYVVWVADLRDGGALVMRATLLTILIIALARLIDRGLGRATRRIFTLAPEIAARFPTLEHRSNRYLPLLRWVLKGIVWIAASMLILAAWEVDSVGWLVLGPGRELLSAALSIAIVLAIAALAWEATSRTIERYLVGQDEEGVEVERSARLKTLLPLLRNALFIAIIVFTGLIVLSELGIDIGPLLAGAGVIGLAIGFGSQALVRDVITGLFILIEDTISVGDIVTVGSHTGVVEEISIRTVRLRDLSGAVHTVPWGDVTSVINLTKDFSYYVMDIGIAYREDVDEVIAVLEALGAELEADPELGREMLGPIEILGVDAFGDSAVVIKARLKTRPTKQWIVGRAFNRRMKKRFDERGIEIPFPHTTLYFGEDKRGKAPPARVVLAPGEADPHPARPAPETPVTS